MTDETEDERPFLLGDGDCMVFDTDYLDPETESVGILAVQFSLDRGLWVLWGGHDGADKYFQEWRQAGAERAPSKRLRPVN